MADASTWLAEARRMRQAAEILLKSAAELEQKAERKDVATGLGGFNVLAWRPTFFPMPKKMTVE
jgi:hypothetical protein